jgi:hypothetical protein
MKKTKNTTTSSPWRQSARLAILQYLNRCPGFQAKPNDVRFGLNQQGFALCADQILVELSWLAQVSNTLQFKSGIAQLTNDGLAVVKGARVIPGIRPPFPNELIH